jgi:hypothetical protein
MEIIGGLDVHRKQITLDYIELDQPDPPRHA